MHQNKESLVEIKKGQFGTGLLIENDGFISLSETEDNRKLMESYIKEDVDGHQVRHVPRPFIVDAVFQKCDVKNANGRIYPESVLKRQVELYQTLIREHRALGQLNHPAESEIDLGRVSHNILELKWIGKTLVGKMELNITDGFANHGIVSSCGDSVANLLLNGYKIGVSSRGVGSVENKMGQSIVGNDFELICWDVVSTPSTPGAWISQSDGSDLKQYVESDQSKEKVIDERIQKMKEILS